MPDPALIRAVDRFYDNIIRTESLSVFSSQGPQTWLSGCATWRVVSGKRPTTAVPYLYMLRCARAASRTCLSSVC